MQPKIIERNKRAGVFYAVTDEGLELPIIDLTHPAFELILSEPELMTLQQQFLQDARGPQKVPPFLRQLLFSIMRRRSVLMRGLMGASGSFMSGMNTYMMKLGSENLNQSFFSSIDRQIAASSAGSYMRLRLQDIVHLLAGALIPHMDASPKAAIHLLNIGGGPAIDSLNVLLVLQKERPGALAERQIYIHSLDLNTAGPDFGARALAAMLSREAPLDGLQISFQHISYNWSEPAGLRSLVESFGKGQNIVAASSEGALFEYGSDHDITGNLQELSDTMTGPMVVAGSVTRADDLGRLANGTNIGSRAALQFRGLEAFTVLANRSGWIITKEIDRLLSHDILLEKAQKKG
jgi:hypothetical protein